MNNLKLDELNMYAKEHDLDVIGIAESWLNESVFDSEVSLPDFVLYRKDRSVVKKGRGGGVLLYVKKSLLSIACSSLNEFSNESVWCELVGDKGSRTLVGVVYKSPSAEQTEINCLLNMLRSLDGKQVLIMGDFNCPGINWNMLEADAMGTGLLEIILDNFWTQHVTVPTREQNILDLVISSEVGMVDDISVDEHLANSDHNIVKFSAILETKVDCAKGDRYDYSKGDYDQLNVLLNAVDWGAVFLDVDVETMWCKFRDIVTDAVKQCVPMKKYKKHTYPRWVTREAKRARKCKQKLWKRFQLSQAYNDKVEYKRALNAATAIYKQAKRNFEEKLSAEVKQNPKSFYAYVRSKAKTKDKVFPLKDANGSVVHENAKVCTILNQYFTSVFTHEDTDCTADNFPILREFYAGDLNDVLHEIVINEDVVLSKLLKLQVNKAAGVDGIVPEILLKAANAICKPLTNIFNASIQSGYVPIDWRRANVTAIFKQGARDNPGNYRPVSLTCIACKIVESIVKQEIEWFLVKHNLIKSSQHGFMKNKSCLTNLLEFLHFVTNEVDSGDAVDVIYLDFQKAFDKVPHKRLLLKLEAYHVTGHVSKWISSWLNGREQRVMLNGNMSEWSSVISGVPQGSVLGPLLFTVYINDIDSAVVSKLSKFADDTKMFNTVSRQGNSATLQSDLTNLFHWSTEWQMLFNLNKCKVVHFGKQDVKASYSIGGVVLDAVDCEKDLGVMVQSDLKVSQQCVKVVKTANKVLGMISRSFQYRTRPVILRLYKALVRPHLEYCVQAWRPHLQKDINLLENVQKRVAKMLGVNKNRYYEKISDLGLTTLETRRLRGDLIVVFKMFKGMLDVNVHDFFTVSHASSRGHSCKLFKERFLTDFGKFSFGNRVVNEWNLLTQDLVDCSTVEQFKIKVDHHLRYGRGFI